MLKSYLVLSKDNIALPESSIEAYRKWEEARRFHCKRRFLAKATHKGP
jgi:hypothetical protein